LSRISLVVAALIVVDCLLAAYVVNPESPAPFPAVVPLGSPTAYLNTYLHVPIAWSALILFTAAFAASIAYLKTRKGFWDDFARSAVALGLAFGLATIVTGMAWAQESWGMAWNWDPKETAVLMLWLAYFGYYILRKSVTDPERVPVLAATYAVAAFVLVPLSFGISMVVESLHPGPAQTAAFYGRKTAAWVLASRSIIATALALTLAYASAARKKLPVALAVLALLLMAGVAAWPMAEYSGLVGRVVDARVSELSGGEVSLEMTVLSGEREIPVRYSGPPPIRPLVVQMPGGGEAVSLVSHVVSVRGEEAEGAIEADEVKILIHPCVPATAAMHGAALAASLLIARRGAGSRWTGERP